MQELWKGDCLELMKNIPTASVDMIKADLPYEMTNNSWDILIPFEPLWEQYNRIIKPNGVITLNAAGVFSAMLIMSNPKMYRYDWIWEKPKATGHLNCDKQPMRAHEQVLIFYKNPGVYNPQKTTGHKPVNSYTKHQTDGDNYGKTKAGISGGGQTDRYPRSVLKFKQDTQLSKLHRTQKPVAMEEYFIRTYTNPDMLVLDNCAGSGTVAIACENLNRQYICIEKGEKQFADMRDRVFTHREKLMFESI